MAFTETAKPATAGTVHGLAKSVQLSTANNSKDSVCGRPSQENRKPIRRRHGMRNTPEWQAWQAAKNRCFNPRNKDFARYGQRGITMCRRWTHGEHGKSGFQCFILDVGKRPTPQHTLDRFPDGNGDYRPGNVRWATRREQSRNREAVKLDPGKVRHIRKSNEPLKGLAELYGCTLGCVWNAKTRLTWREVRP